MNHFFNPMYLGSKCDECASRVGIICGTCTGFICPKCHKRPSFFRMLLDWLFK